MIANELFDPFPRIELHLGIENAGIFEEDRRSSEGKAFDAKGSKTQSASSNGGQSPVSRKSRNKDEEYTFRRVIVYGHWDLYSRMIETVYNGKHPKISYFGYAIESIIAKGYDQRLYSLLCRLDYFGVKDKEKFYRLCFQVSLQHGRKDLAEYFLPYIGNPEDEARACLKKKGRVFYKQNRDIPHYLQRYLDEDVDITCRRVSTSSKTDSTSTKSG